MRKELAAKARERGRKDLAIRIAATKRPSPVVWLANAVAREHRDDVMAVLDAGEAVRSAYASGDVAAIRDATRRRQQAVSAVLRSARTILEQAGGSSANERRLARTLLGATIDPPQAALLAKGRLEHEIEPAALEGVFAEAPKIEKMAAEKRTGTEKRDREAAKADAARRRAHEAAVRAQQRNTERAAARAERAEAAAAEKRAEAETAHKEAENAEAEARDARAAAQEEQKKLERLQRE